MDYCAGKGIVVQAYSPLVKARMMGDPPLVDIAHAHGVSPAQVGDQRPAPDVCTVTLQMACMILGGWVLGIVCIVFHTCCFPAGPVRL